MYEQREAIRLILESLKSAGLEWYRRANTADDDLFKSRISGPFSVFEGSEHHTLSKKPSSSLPSKKILIIPPSGSEKEELLGLWLRWDFDKTPFEFRLFIGQWSKINGAKTFAAFRFDAPEKGSNHNYYHCQPCRNFGDKEVVPNAALMSEHFPTIPINASNIVELTVCAILSCMGHKTMKYFMRDVLATSGADNDLLKKAYRQLIILAP